MKKGSAASIALFSGFFLLAYARTGYSAPTNVELVIDDSGSMAQKVEGQSKIAIAKQVLSEMVPDLPKDAQVAVRTYGRQRPSSQHDCSDMELLIPFGPNNSDRVLPGVQALKPNGMTPIASSLQAAAANDFVGKEGQNNIIILLSDGQEDCNGDPCTVAKLVHAAGIHLQINVIGFHVQPKEREQLKCVADAAGGKYYDASNAKELKVAASEVKAGIEASPAAAATPSATPTPFVKAEEPLYGDPIRGGDSYEKAVPLPVGKLFHLDHQQPQKAHDFFAIQAHGGQAIKVSIATGPSKGSIGAIIADSKRTELVNNDIDCCRRDAVVVHDVADQQDGTYYILIGDPYYTVEQEDTFRADLIDHADANSGRDAGAIESRALEITPGLYNSNHLSDTDTVDIFKFKADGGTAYSFKARPGNPKTEMRVEVTDSDGTAIGQGDSGNAGAAAKAENFKIAKTGTILIKVTCPYGDKNTSYAFALGKGDIDSPPAPPPE